MAKYGTCTYSNFKYGDGQACNPPTVRTGVMQWIVLIEWDNSLVNEFIYLDYPVSIERGKQYFVSRNGQGLESIYPGRASITLNNIDGRFDAYNASGPLYGNIAPNKKIIIMVKDLVTGTMYTVFTGWIQNISPINEGQVAVEAYDDLEMLNRNDANIELMFGATVSEGIKAVLDNLEITGYSIGSTIQPLQVFSADAENALSVVDELANASLGHVFVDNAGHFRYYPYTKDDMATHAIDEDVVAKVIELAQPWDELRNDITVYAKGYVKTKVKQIWLAPSSVLVPSGGSITVEAVFEGIVQPIPLEADTDYMAAIHYNPGPPIVWTPSISAYLTNITSKGGDVILSNSAPYDIATHLQIRGYEYMQSYSVARRSPDYYWTPQTENISISTTRKYDAIDTSVPIRKRSKFVLDSRYLHDGNFASLFKNLLYNKLRLGAKNPVLQIQSRPDYQFTAELMDKIHFTSAVKGIDNTYKLGRVAHQWLGEGGQDVVTTMHLIDPIYSATVPTPEILPEPEIPEIPTITPPGELPPGDGGLENCILAAPANGPFAVAGLLGEYTATPGQEAKSGAFAAIARPAHYTNPTYVIFTGETTSTITVTIDLIQIGTGVSIAQAKVYSYNGGTRRVAITPLGVGNFDAVRFTTEGLAGSDALTTTIDIVDAASMYAVAGSGKNASANIYAEGGQVIGEWLAGSDVLRGVPVPLPDGGANHAKFGAVQVWLNRQAWLDNIVMSAMVNAGGGSAGGLCQIQYNNAEGEFLNQEFILTGEGWNNDRVLTDYAGLSNFVTFYVSASGTEPGVAIYGDNFHMGIHFDAAPGAALKISAFDLYNVCPQ